MKVLDFLVDKMTSQSIERMGRVSEAFQAKIVKADRLFLGQVERMESMEKLAQLKILTENLNQRESEAILSNEAWNILFDAIPDLVCVIDLNFNIVRVNEAFLNKFGVELKDILNKKCFRVFHESNDVPGFCPHIRTLEDSNTHKCTHYEENIDCHFLTTTTPLKDSEGKIFGTIHISRDISIRVKQNRMLEEQHKMMARLCNGTDAYIWAKDVNDGYKFVNVTFSELLKVEASKIIGKSDKGLLDEDLVNIEGNTILANCGVTDKITKESKRPCKFIEIGLVNGEEKVLEVTKNPTFKGGKVFGTIGIAVDITERNGYLKAMLDGLVSVKKAKKINSNIWQIFSDE